MICYFSGLRCFKAVFFWMLRRRYMIDTSWEAALYRRHMNLYGSLLSDVL